MVKYLPKEILPGDLLAGARFNVMISHCLTEKETKEYDSLIYGKNGARAAMLWFHNHGYGNTGATSGHLVPGYARILEARLEGGQRRPAAALRRALPPRRKRAGKARNCAPC